MNRPELASSLRAQGTHNCAQAVACVFSNLTPLPEQTLKASLAGMAAGLACGKGSCGAIIGASMVLGLSLSPKEALKASGRISRKFIERFGAISCEELRQNNIQVADHCSLCVRFAAQLVEEELNI